MTRHVRLPVVGRALKPFGSDFVSVEALGGTVLAVATVSALVWANVAGASYDELWASHLTIGLGTFSVSVDLRHWVNDGLMTLFFFVVGLEIKRELVEGELRERRTASLPAIAAVGGMAIPALLYSAVNAGGPGSRGWAIPMATDIAFAVVVLGVLGSRIPNALRLFLLTLAIVDDIGAIFVIALFYSEQIAFAWLLGACGVVALVVLAQRLGLANPLFYVVPAFALWVCAFESGVHPTIAGVALGLLTPVRPIRGRRVIDKLEFGLHPWSSLLVIPVFAVANAGVNLDADAWDRALTSPITWGIILGLVVGKPAGIVLATMLGVRLRLGRLPDGVSMRQIFGAGCVAGIGFTVSLFVADLSFAGARLGDAKVGIIVASAVSAAIGSTWLFRTVSR
jgi:NhaA family Na+:H+ antiporter